MELKSITMVSFGYLDEGFLRPIAAAVGQEFNALVSTKEGRLDLSDFYDPVRRQYHGTTLLKEVDSLYAADSKKVIGLFNVDLFIPILTYIFGQAYLNGRTAVASLYRFKNERYGMATDDRSIPERFKKEVIHELGHTFGLIHCHVPSCVMQSSTYVEDIDLKTWNLCTKCRNEIRLQNP